jgi:hypothetical protein
MLIPGFTGCDPKLPYGGLADQFPGDSERGSLRQTAGASAGRYSPLRRLLRGAPRLDCFGK